MTVDTPITTPRMVSAERSLLARIASSAIATPSPSIAAGSSLFGSERGDRIEPRGAAWPDTRRRGCPLPAPSARATRHRPERHPGGQGREARHERAPAAHPPSTPSTPPSVASTIASTRNWRRMSRRRGAQRLADADLAGALVDRHQHDVHDHDPADDDADADHRRNGREEQPGEASPERDQGVGLVDGEVVRARRAAAGAPVASPLRPAPWRRRSPRRSAILTETTVVLPPAVHRSRRW